MYFSNFGAEICPLNFIRLTTNTPRFSYCANVSAFLMFKTQRTNLEFHPITTRLVQYKQLLDKMGPLDEAMRPEIDKILSVVNKHQGDGAKKVAKALKKMTLKHNKVEDDTAADK